MTGAVVERQPFGGCKESSFGKGAKAGGPNYVVQFMHPKQIDLPPEQAPLNEDVQKLTDAVESMQRYKREITLWKNSVGSYAFRWNAFFSHQHDPSLVRGQDNLHCYKPHAHVVLRGQFGDSSFNLLRVIAAALTCGAEVEISVEEEEVLKELLAVGVDKFFPLKQESEEYFARRIRKGKIERVRLLSHPAVDLQNAFSETACRLNIAPVVANGRLELLHLLREVNISHDYHRYGYLGMREKLILEDTQTFEEISDAL